MGLQRAMGNHTKIREPAALDLLEGLRALSKAGLIAACVQLLNGCVVRI